MIVAQEGEPKTLDVHMENKGFPLRVNKQIYSRLVEADGDLKIFAGLAESWKYIDDSTIEFKLRQGVKFHNNYDFTAEDVKFSFERIKNSPQVANILPNLKVEIIDNYTIKIITMSKDLKTKIPFGPLLAHLSHPAMSIVSKKLLTENPNALKEIPIGTGPYKFESWQIGDKITLARNDNYFQEPAKFEKLIFKNIPEASNRMIGLETGELDIALTISNFDEKSLSANKKLKALKKPSLSYSYLGINNENPKFKNKKVRAALNYAINKQALIDVVLDGQGIIANSPIAPGVFGYTAKTKSYPYDSQKAKQLLKEAGFEKGFKTKITILPSEQQTATIIQSNLKDVGIIAEIDSRDPSAFFEFTASGKKELFLSSWGAVTGDANYGLYDMYHSTSRGDIGNRDFYSNKEVDKLLEDGIKIIDQEKRKKIYERVQEIIVDDAADVMLFYRTLIVGTQTNIEGLNIHPTTLHDFYPVYKK
ncbi:MAG: ABC transporter substrate-binding protein [Fusobacteriaceae bacterium]